MKVLMISGDQNILIAGTPAFRRAQLLRDRVELLSVVYWGRGNLWPRIPKGHFDVITTQDPFWRGLIGLFIAKFRNIRLHVQIHADLAAQSYLKRILSACVLKRADAVRVVSEKIKKQVARLGVTVPISVLPVYVELKRFEHIEHVPHMGKHIVWIGRFEKEKDPEQAIAVLREVKKVYPEVSLIMLGKGSLEDVLRKCAEGLSVEFPGWQDPVPFLAKADMVLSTSPYESYGLSIVEALAAGVPVVSYDVGIAREAGAIIATGRDGLVQKTLDTLQNRSASHLKIQPPSEDDWVVTFLDSLAG